MICLGIILLCALSVQCRENAHFFTEEENQFLFQSNIAPEYEIVEVSHKIQKRSLEKFYGHVFLNTFKRNLTLYLEPIDSVLFGERTEIWSAEPNYKSPEGVKYKVISNFKNLNFQMLHDVSNMAAIALEKDDNGNVELYGQIGEDLVIQPLPERIKTMYNARKIRNLRDSFYYKPFLDKNNFSQSYNYKELKYNLNSNTSPHIIHKLPLVNYNKGSKKRQKSFWVETEPIISTINTVYPEILVILDNGLYNKMYRDVEAIKKYIATYWSAVDLRYRQLSNPAVRLNIAAVILSTGKEEVPFIKSSLYDQIKINADKVLIETGKHLLSNKVFQFRDNFDMSLIMTSRNMCTTEIYGDDCTTMGYAYVSSACSVLKSEDNSYKMVEGVGMVEDNGGFKGIMLAVHELGHILGVEHDNVDNCIYRYGIEDGYIMENQLAFNANSFYWSPCSLRNFNIFLNHANATCLRNKPIIGGKMKNFLPGLHYSLEHQCDKHYPGSKPCIDGLFLQNICTELNCILPFTDTCKRTVPAAEGSPCGLNSICLNGKCISSNDDYYHYKISDG